MALAMVAQKEDSSIRSFLPSTVDTTFQTALKRLGKTWLSSSETFDARFVTHLQSVYTHLLSVWPENARPEQSLALLSKDIAEHLRPAVEKSGADAFGLWLSTRSHDRPEDIPLYLLYDLDRGVRAALPDIQAAYVPERAILVGYAPLNETEIEKYLAYERDRAENPFSEKVINDLKTWQQDFIRTLAMAQADSLMSMEAQTAMLGLLKQGRIFHGALFMAQARMPTDIKAETQKMRNAIVAQITSGTLPESVRAALRQSLVKLDNASNEKPMIWVPQKGLVGTTERVIPTVLNAIKATTAPSAITTVTTSTPINTHQVSVAQRGAQVVHAAKNESALVSAITASPAVSSIVVAQSAHSTASTRPASLSTQTSIPSSESPSLLFATKASQSALTQAQTQKASPTSQQILSGRISVVNEIPKVEISTHEKPTVSVQQHSAIAPHRIEEAAKTKPQQASVRQSINKATMPCVSSTTLTPPISRPLQTTVQSKENRLPSFAAKNVSLSAAAQSQMQQASPPPQHVLPERILTIIDTPKAEMPRQSPSQPHQALQTHKEASSVVASPPAQQAPNTIAGELSQKPLASQSPPPQSDKNDAKQQEVSKEKIAEEKKTEEKKETRINRQDKQKETKNTEDKNEEGEKKVAKNFRSACEMCTHRNCATCPLGGGQNREALAQIASLKQVQPAKTEPSVQKNETQPSSVQKQYKQQATGMCEGCSGGNCATCARGGGLNRAALNNIAKLVPK